jgi:hypothetical protein
MSGVDGCPAVYQSVKRYLNSTLANNVIPKKKM